MNRRLVSSALVAILGITTLTGCGSKDGDIFSQKVEGEITVSCYESTTYKSYLEEAARKFEAKYPSTKVNVEAAGSMPEVKTQEDDSGKKVSIMKIEDDQQAKEDYISKINTELMSGKGADVVALDILPYYQYADNGQLADLDDYMKNDSTFNKSDYAGNILDGAQYKGGQFLFPIDYTFNYFAYDSSLDPSFSAKDKLTFSDAINAVKDKAKETGNKIFGLASYASKGTSLAAELFNQNYESFIDVANKKANLDDGEFAKLLETAKAYADEGYIEQSNVTEPKDSSDSSGTVSMSMFGQSQQEKYYIKSNSNFNLINQFTRNLGQQGNRVMVSGSGGGDTSNDEIAGLIANDQGEVQFSYSMGFGINNNSKNKRTAWEFLKFLASEEMQTSGLARPDSVPVNKNAREQLAAMSITGEAMQIQAGAAGMSVGDKKDDEQTSKELTPEQKTALENYLKQLDKFSSQLNKYVVHDAKVDDMILTEVKYFFTGEKSADEVANTLQSKVKLYLNE